MRHLLTHLVRTLNGRSSRRVAQSARARDLTQRGRGRHLVEAARRGGDSFHDSDKTIITTGARLRTPHRP